MANSNTVFKLTFPDEGWKETSVFSFQGPFDHGVQHNLVLVIDPEVNKDIPLEKYARVQMEGPKNALPGYGLDREREIVLKDGTPAYEVIYHYVPTDNVVLFQKQIYKIKDSKAYIFTATYSKRTLETIAPLVDGIINSFTLVDPDRIA